MIMEIKNTASQNIGTVKSQNITHILLVSEPVTGSTGAMGGCHILLEEEISISIKLALVLHRLLVGGAVADFKTQWSDCSRGPGGPNHQ